MTKKTPEVRAPKFKPGDMVFMHMAAEDQDPDFPSPDEVGKVDGAEGWDYDEHRPENIGEWMEHPDFPIMYVVTVPRNQRLDPETGKRDPDDDGLREVSEDQLSYYRPTGHRRIKR